MTPETLRAGAEPGRAAPLFSLGEVVAATGGRLLAGDPRAALGGVALDTRAVCGGDLFCAIRGERVDAHRLLPAAVAAGAAAVLVDRSPGDGWSLDGLPAPRGAVLVPSVATALARLAIAHLARLPVRVAAVTGSVGKTGTRTLIAAALGAGGQEVLAAQDSFNTEWTVPLVCLRAGPQHAFAALELAMRGRGEIAYLAEVCRPEVGVLTVIGESHLEALGSVEAIIAAKGELVAGLPPDGVAVLNRDDPRQAALSARAPCRVLGYGLAPGAEVRATAIAVGPSGSTFTAVLRGRRFPVRLQLLGAHQVGNALAALACADAMGVPIDAAAEALSHVRAWQSRLQVRDFGRIRVLDDAYNAAPQSTVAALQVLATQAPVAARAAVLGDMLELGAAADAGHARVGRVAAGIGMRWLLTVGALAAGIARAAVAGGMPATSVFVVKDQAGVAALLPKLLCPDLTVLVKGSRAVGLEDTVAAIAAWGHGDHS